MGRFIRKGKTAWKYYREKKFFNMVFFDIFPLTCMCVDIYFRLFNDWKAEEIPSWKKKKMNVFFWTLLQVLSDWRIYRQHWWQLAKWAWYDKKLCKKISKAIIGFKQFISGNSCEFVICRVFFVCFFWCREMGFFETLKYI